MHANICTEADYQLSRAHHNILACLMLSGKEQLPLWVSSINKACSINEEK